MRGMTIGLLRIARWFGLVGMMFQRNCLIKILTENYLKVERKQ
jgi:hypothetical protein